MHCRVVGNESSSLIKTSAIIDIESPGKLRKEKGQLKNSPTTELTQDLTIGPMLNKFQP
jgi:hypothetical protein